MIASDRDLGVASATGARDPAPSDRPPGDDPALPPPDLVVPTTTAPSTGSPATGPTATPESTAPPGLTVGGVARRLGVAPATLRTWARRYGMGPTAHVAGAHRRYGPEDVARLDLMRRLVDAGSSPADAARAARSASGDPLARPGSGLGPGLGVGRPATDTAVLPVGGHVVPEHPPARDPIGASEVDDLTRAAEGLDGARALALLTAEIDRCGVVGAWEHLLEPVLLAENPPYRSGQLAADNLLCEAATLAAARVSNRSPGHRNARPVLLAGAVGECEPRHAVVLRMIAAALAQQQIHAQPIGVALPTDVLVVAVRRAGPAAVLVWSSSPGVAEADELAVLAGLRPTPLVLAGGPGWGGPCAGVATAPRLRDAVTGIAEVVG